MGYQIVDKESGRILLGSVEIADSFWSRFMGLMGRPCLDADRGLLLKKTGSVHTCFMKFPIQVLYLDYNYQIIAAETLPPWKCGGWYRGARHVLEIGIDDTVKFYQGMRLSLLEK